MTELQHILWILKTLGEQGPQPGQALRGGTSRATFNRRLQEARHMGAEIEAVQSGGAWVYRLVNWSAIAPRVLRWLELEESRSLVG